MTIVTCRDQIADKVERNLNIAATTTGRVGASRLVWSTSLVY